MAEVREREEQRKRREKESEIRGLEDEGFEGFLLDTG